MERANKADKLDFRQAQLLYSRALRTVHDASTSNSSSSSTDATAGLSAAADDLHAAWTHFVADREHLLEIVRHLGRVTVVKTMKARAARASGKARGSAVPLARTPRRPASPAKGSARPSPNRCPPSPESPRRLLRRSPVAHSAGRPSSVARRRLRFGDAAKAAEGTDNSGTAQDPTVALLAEPTTASEAAMALQLMGQMAACREATERMLAGLIQQMQLASA